MTPERSLCWWGVSLDDNIIHHPSIPAHSKHAHQNTKHKIQNTEYKIQQTIYKNRVLDEGPVDPKVIAIDRWNKSNSEWQPLITVKREKDLECLKSYLARKIKAEDICRPLCFPLHHYWSICFSFVLYLCSRSPFFVDSFALYLLLPRRKIWVGGQLQTPFFYFASLLEYLFFHLFCICVPGVLYLLIYLLCICFCPKERYEWEDSCRLLCFTLRHSWRGRGVVTTNLPDCPTYYPLTKLILNIWSWYVLK